MNIEDQERTEQYANGIANTVRLIEALAATDVTDPDVLAELSGTETEELAEIVDFPETLKRGVDYLDALAEHAADYLEDHGGSVVEAWLETVLDIEATYRRSLGSPGDVDPEDIAILVTVGGPDARVHLDDIHGHARIEVHWGNSHAVRHLYAPHLSERVYDLEEITREATR